MAAAGQPRPVAVAFVIVGAIVGATLSATLGQVTTSPETTGS